MLKILNERSDLNDVNEINKLGVVRFEKYYGNYTPSTDITMLKYESDIYVPKNWVLISNKDNIKLFTSEVVDSNYVALKTETECRCNVKDAISFLSDVENIPHYNHTIDKVEIVKKMTGNNCIYKTTSMKLYGITVRDFILFNNIYYNKREDAHYVFSLSVNNDSINKKYKTLNDNVRGEIKITGYYLKQLNDNKCKISMVSHIELNGLIPTIAINNLIHNDTINIVKKIINKLEGK